MTSEKLSPEPFEQRDPQFGKLVAFFIDKLAVKKPAQTKVAPGYIPFFNTSRTPANNHHPIYYIDTWSNESGIGRNDKCPCNSGKKFKQCCINS